MVAMLCLLCFPVQVMAETQQGTNGDELQLMEAEKLEIQLGTDWAGVEFQLKTDAGLYPGTVVVGQDGVLSQFRSRRKLLPQQRQTRKKPITELRRRKKAAQPLPAFLYSISYSLQAVWWWQSAP